MTSSTTGWFGWVSAQQTSSTWTGEEETKSLAEIPSALGICPEQVVWLPPLSAQHLGAYERTCRKMRLPEVEQKPALNITWLKINSAASQILACCLNYEYSSKCCHFLKEIQQFLWNSKWFWIEILCEWLSGSVNTVVIISSFGC